MDEHLSQKIQQGFSLVLPCYNLEKTIYQNIEKAKSYLEKRFAVFEIIAVNDGSSDETLRELNRAKEDFAIQVVTYTQNQGKGYAVRRGVMRANQPLIGFLDADLAIPVDELERFVSEILRGSDVVIASRLHPGGQVLIPVLWYRLFMERVFRYLRVAIINGWRVRDTQCGCKVFTREVKERLFPLLRINRFAFDAELIFLALRFGYKIAELPITLQNPKTSSIRILRDSLIMFRDLLRVRWGSIWGKYTVRQIQNFEQGEVGQITFDDFGISPKVNQRILELLKKYPHARVAIMMNGKYTEEEKKLLIESGAHLDLHLDRHDVPSHHLVHSSFLRRGARFIQEIALGNKAQIKDFWTLQLKAFEEEFGRLPERLNTHEHVHFFPLYFSQLLILASHNNIREIRFGWRYTASHSIIACVLNILRWYNYRKFSRSQLETSEYLLSWDWLRGSREKLEEYIMHGETEVIFHLERDEEYQVLKQW